MPLLWGVLSSLLTGLGVMFKSRIGSWIAQALLFFGIAWATNTFAVQPWLDLLEDKMMSVGGAGEYGAVALQWFGLLNFDVACTMLMSAVAAKFLGDQAKAFLVKRG